MAAIDFRPSQAEPAVPQSGWASLTEELQAVITFVHRPVDAEYVQALQRICRQVAAEIRLAVAMQRTYGAWKMRFTRLVPVALVEEAGQ